MCKSQQSNINYSLGRGNGLESVSEEVYRQTDIRRQKGGCGDNRVGGTTLYNYYNKTSGF